MDQTPLLQVGLSYSPKLQAKQEAEAKGRSKPRKPEPVSAPQLSLIEERWYVLQRQAEGKRGTLIVVCAEDLKKYLQTKKKYKEWSMLNPDGHHCKSRAEAQDLAEGWGAMVSLEDPSKAPNREGTTEELGRLQALKRQIENSEKTKPPMADREIDLLSSILFQWERFTPHTLSPKQWAFIWRFYSQVEDRLQRRYQRRNEGKR
jgi:hypothetical protein